MKLATLEQMQAERVAWTHQRVKGGLKPFPSDVQVLRLLEERSQLLEAARSVRERTPALDRAIAFAEEEVETL